MLRWLLPAWLKHTGEGPLAHEGHTCNGLLGPPTAIALQTGHIEKTKQRSEKQSSVLSIDQIQWYTVCNDVHTDF